MSISTDIISRTIPGLPSRDELVELCNVHYREHFKINHRGTSHYVYRPSDTSTPLALIKFGPLVGLGEARTQSYVYHLSNRDPSAPFKVAEVYDAWKAPKGVYIVMEYIAGVHATEADVPRVVEAVNWLLKVPPPQDGKVGPVGGGPMRHSFWPDGEGPTFESVQQMDFQLNNVLKFLQDTINLSADPICFYHDDLILNNFIVSGQDLYVIEFGYTGFAPETFMCYSLANPRSTVITRHIKYRQSQNLPSLSRAYYYFAVTDNNKLGWEKPVKFRR